MTSPSIIETQEAMQSINVYFQYRLSTALNLLKVDAPLVVHKDSGLNDGLTGSQSPISFNDVEVVQSLAKWKRYAIQRYGIPIGKGIYTEMIALRPGETLSPLHALTVKQYDWELHIDNTDRNITYLQRIVSTIYRCIVDTQIHICELYPYLYGIDTLPQDIHIISTSDLEHMYPSMTPKEREHAIAKRYGAVFISQIGYKHDLRAFDYDSWDLNGDIIVWSSVMDTSIELSSMGIRVDSIDLLRQCNGLVPSTQYHESIINSTIPLTIGGGIGQSRLYMFLLHKKHIGEVVCSTWPSDIGIDIL